MGEAESFSLGSLWFLLSVHQGSPGQFRLFALSDSSDVPLRNLWRRVHLCKLLVTGLVSDRAVST